MTEHPPSTLEVDDNNARIDTEREQIELASEAERTARAAESEPTDPEFAERRVISLGDARDAVMAAFEHTQPEQSVATPGEAIDQDTDEKPTIVLKDIISDRENSAVVEAEAHLRALQAAQHSPEGEVSSELENEPGPGIIARVHDQVEHARSVIGNVEQKITSTLGRAENVLRQVGGYLDTFEDENRVQAKLLGIDDKVKKIHFLVNQTADIIGETHGAISTGASAIDTPLRLLETLTERTDEDTATQTLATESLRDLRGLQDGSPTSLSHEDLQGIDSNLNELQRPKLSREQMLGLVQNTLQMVHTYNQMRDGAEQPDSPKKSRLQRIARGLEVYLEMRR